MHQVKKLRAILRLCPLFSAEVFPSLGCDLVISCAPSPVLGFQISSVCIRVMCAPVCTCPCVFMWGMEGSEPVTGWVGTQAHCGPLASQPQLGPAAGPLPSGPRHGDTVRLDRSPDFLVPTLSPVKAGGGQSQPPQEERVHSSPPVVWHAVRPHTGRRTRVCSHACAHTCRESRVARVRGTTALPRSPSSGLCRGGGRGLAVPGGGQSGSPWAQLPSCFQPTPRPLASQALRYLPQAHAPVPGGSHFSRTPHFHFPGATCGTSQCRHSVQNFPVPCRSTRVHSLVPSRALTRFVQGRDLLSLTSLLPRGPPGEQGPLRPTAPARPGRGH